jgi:hypothetical protein
MKKIAIILLTVITLTNASGQTDNHENTVLIIELISEEEPEGFKLSEGNYTIENKISYNGSSVYYSNWPTLADYVNSSILIVTPEIVIFDGKEILRSISPNVEIINAQNSIY